MNEIVVSRPLPGARLFIKRTPASCWEEFDSIDDLCRDELDIRVRCRPDYWEHLVVAQGYAGWSDDQLGENWSAFSSYPIWHLFDVSDVAIAFHAVTAVMIIARMGEIAREQVK